LNSETWEGCIVGAAISGSQLLELDGWSKLQAEKSPMTNIHLTHAQ